LLHDFKKYKRRDSRLDKVKWKPHLAPLSYIKKKKRSSESFNENASDLLLRLNQATFWKDKKLESPRQRMVKSYNIYKLFMTGDSILKLNRRVKLSEFKTHYGINETNKVVGWTPDYLGSSKSRIVKKTNFISKLTKDCLEKFLMSVADHL
jgi:hypothetical protein